MKRHPSITAARFIEELLSRGRYTFTREEVASRLGTSAAATSMSLHRLMKANRLVLPRSGFYVIVDPQHRAAGTLPPEWFIDPLMKDMARPCYVGLLSAAQHFRGIPDARPREYKAKARTRQRLPGRAIRCIRACERAP